MSLFALMANCQYAIPRHDVASRFSVTFGLLLTAVAYKISYADGLPRVSYMTALDKYVLSCTLIIVVACFEVSAVGIILNQEVDALCAAGSKSPDLYRLSPFGSPLPFLLYSPRGPRGSRAATAASTRTMRTCWTPWCSHSM